ncbi:MAG TPA: hypothetical protein VKC60_09225 [Opitutaceae bacterium]|nr:hypothetical protein [Opitutaceae bacterium]
MKIIRTVCALLFAVAAGVFAASSAIADPVDSTVATNPCPRCGGTGVLKCTANGCKDGKRDCPGPCLKINHGVWQHMDVKGHSSDELWQKFTPPNGQWHAWTTAHLGEVIELHDGQYVDVGKCKICGGTTHVPCEICKGTAQVPCPICHGTKVVSASSSPDPTPGTPSIADIILKNGSTVSGHIVLRNDAYIVVKMANGKLNKIPLEELADSSATKK